MTIKPWVLIAVGCVVAAAALAYMHQDQVLGLWDQANSHVAHLLGKPAAAAPATEVPVVVAE